MTEVRWLDVIINSMDMSLSKLREAWHAAVHGVNKKSDTTTGLNNKEMKTK